MNTQQPAPLEKLPTEELLAEVQRRKDWKRPCYALKVTKEQAAKAHALYPDLTPAASVRKVLDETLKCNTNTQ